MLIQRSLKSWLCGILIITFTWISVFAVGTQPSFAFSQADVDKLTSTKVCMKCDLSDANLSGANLSNAKLSGANLSNANLSGANLSNATILGANLSSADLSSADLSNATILGANLSSADLRLANLSSADLRLANLSSADLSSADLRLANLRTANLTSTILIDANMTGAQTPADVKLEQLKDERMRELELYKSPPTGYSTGRLSPNSAQVTRMGVVFEKVCINETRGSLFKTYCRFPDGGCRNPGQLSPGEFLVGCLCRGTSTNSIWYKPTDFPSVSEFKAKCDPAP